MYKIQEHKQEIITNLISNIVWYLLTLFVTNLLLWIPLIHGIYNNIKDSTKSIPLHAFILAGLSVIIMFFLMVISIIISIKLYKSRNTSEEIVTDLIFENLDIELYFKNRKEIVTYLTHDCIVNKEDYEQFKKSIFWTGYKYNYTKLLEASGNYELIDSTRKASPYPYSVNFNEKLKIGKKIHFKLETSVSDDDCSMNPVFSHTIKQQTNNFTIRLTVPRNLIKNIKPVVYRDLTRTIKVPHNIQLEQNYVGDLIQYSYTVKNPKMLNNYCIEWDFK